MVWFLGIVILIVLVRVYISNANVVQEVSSLKNYIKLNREEQNNLLKILVHDNVSLAKVLDEVPSKTLNTIQGSANNVSGKLGELIGLLELKSQYDRLIAMGDIVDFLAIRFPSKDRPGSIEFIDVKTGKGARLSSDQRKLKKLIEEDKDSIDFKVVTISKQ